VPRLSNKQAETALRDPLNLIRLIPAKGTRECQLRWFWTVDRLCHSVQHSWQATL